MRHYPAVFVIWIGCALAWMALGTSLVARTGSTSGALGQEVQRLWGPALVQKPPTLLWERPRQVMAQVKHTDEHGQVTWTEEPRTETEYVPLPLDGSALAAKIGLTHRQKGLLWFATYGIDFDGRYRFTDPDDQPHEAELTVPLASGAVLFDGFEVLDETDHPLPVHIAGDEATVRLHVDAHGERTVRVRYRSRGTSSWTYQLTEGTGEVRDFALAMTTDFANVDWAPGSLSPSTQHRSAQGWSGEWRFHRLVANSGIALVLPEKLAPGPLASRITFFAPVGLLFFFFVVAIVATVHGRRIHPMNYFFFGTAFFAFHLLFAYLIDHLPLAPSFAIAAVVSIVLVVSYARLFTGWWFAWRRIALAQFLYLVLFSISFFWSGYTGLAITIGAILTLYVMMQATGRLDWDAASRAPNPAPTA